MTVWPQSQYCSFAVRASSARSAAHFAKTILDMHPEKACDHNDNDDYADDVENIHCLAPI